MTILSVGAGQTYSTLAAAVAASASGDTINVQAGDYVNDFTQIYHPLTINGVGGLAHFIATVAPPNGKAIMTVDANLTIDHLEFSGAAVPDANGAGIRYDSGNLVVTNSWFHNNENGLLSAPGPGSISIDHSEFSFNGNGNGGTHNIYIGDVASFTVTNSYFHDVNAGHEIKSRAASNTISNNVIADGPTSTASYSIDLPDGGLASITGNVLQKGPNATNHTFISVAEETPVYPGTDVTISGNTFINNLPPGSTPIALRNPTDVPVSLTDNTLYGFGPSYVIGAATVSGNTLLPLPGPPITPPGPAAVPEPATLTLLLPLLALAAATRRRLRARGARNTARRTLHMLPVAAKR